MSRRDRLINGIDRGILTVMMLAIAFVLEKALERMVEPKDARKRSRLGQRLFQRFGPTAHMRHHHSKAAAE